MGVVKKFEQKAWSKIGRLGEDCPLILTECLTTLDFGVNCQHTELRVSILDLSICLASSLTFEADDVVSGVWADNNLKVCHLLLSLSLRSLSSESALGT